MSKDFAAFIFEITVLIIVYRNCIVYTREANFHYKVFEIYETNMYSYLRIITIHRATRQ